MKLKTRIDELVKEYGNLRAAGEAVQIDYAYLSRLASGEKKNPSAETLRRLELVEVRTYMRMVPNVQIEGQPASGLSLSNAGLGNEDQAW